MSVSRPVDVSSHGILIDTSVDAALIAVGLIFVVALAWMIAAILRGRRERGAGAAGATAPGDGARSIHWKLGLALAFFVGLDVPLAVMSTRDLSASIWNFDRAESDPHSLRMEVQARQWTWEGRFPGHDGVFATADDVVTRGELRVPVGKPIILQMASSDVVHSFHLPNHRVQQDIVPGHLAHALFTATSVGTFEVTCTQFCGANHFQMLSPVQVLASDEFDAWLAEASDRAPRESVMSDPAGWGWPWRTP